MINEFCDKITKWQVIKDTVNGIGKIKIIDDKVYCYVDGKKLKDRQTISDYYLINTNGIDKKLYGKYFLEEFDLCDKPINYIFSNIYFNEKILISSSDKANLIFENCVFTNSIQIDKADNVVFKNNKYHVFAMYGVNGFVGTEFSFLSSDKNSVNSINFCNGKVIPSRKNIKVNEPLNMFFDLKAKKVRFTNTDFYEISSMKIDCDKLIINNNKITVDELEIIADKIVCDYCNDIFVKIAVIDNKNKDYNIIMDCIFDNMFFNGVEIDKNIDYYPTDEMLEFQRERVNLIDTLRTVYNNCSNNISGNLIEQETNMKKQSITKVLKK